MTKTRSRPDAKGPQTIDGQTGMAEPAPRRIDLSTLRDVRLEMAAVYRCLDAGDLAAQEATRRVYILGEIGKVITLAELERRIGELEERRGHALSDLDASQAVRRIG